MQLTVKTNIAKAQGDLKKFQQAMEKAEVSANKKIAKQSVTEISKQTRADINIKAKHLKKAVSVSRYGQRRAARISISGRGMSLGYYGAVQGEKGVSVKVIKARGKKLIRHSFIQVLKSGHAGVFIRKVIGGKRVGRDPIKYLYGPSAKQLLSSDKAKQIIRKFIHNKFKKVYEHEVEFYTKKL